MGLKEKAIIVTASRDNKGHAKLLDRGESTLVAEPEQQCQMDIGEMQFLCLKTVRYSGVH